MSCHYIKANARVHSVQVTNPDYWVNESLTMIMSRFSQSWSGTVSFNTSSSDIPLKRSRFFRDVLAASVTADDGGGADGEHLAICDWPQLMSSRLLPLLLPPFRHLSTTQKTQCSATNDSQVTVTVSKLKAIRHIVPTDTRISVHHIVTDWLTYFLRKPSVTIRNR